MSSYITIWLRFAQLSTAHFLSNRIDSFCYLIGKIVRFGFYILLIFALYAHTDIVAGYGPYELLLFFLVYNILDLLTQTFFRGLYIFKNIVRQGTFDFMLVKPINLLFHIMSRLIDPLDVIFLIPIIALLVWNISMLSVPISIMSVLSFLFFLLIGFLILTGFHILCAAFIVVFVDADNAIWTYRYLLTLGRFPPEIFSPAFALFFTLAVPVFVVTAFPAKALLGLLSPFWGILALVIAAVFFLVSLWLWNMSLKHYSSASS